MSSPSRTSSPIKVACRFKSTARPSAALPPAGRSQRLTKPSPRQRSTHFSRNKHSSSAQQSRGSVPMITPLQKSLSLLALFAALLATSVAAEPSSFDLRSPDNRIEVRIRTTHQITYDVLLKGRALLL